MEVRNNSHRDFFVSNLTQRIQQEGISFDLQEKFNELKSVFSPSEQPSHDDEQAIWGTILKGFQQQQQTWKLLKSEGSPGAQEELAITKNIVRTVQSLYFSLNSLETTMTAPRPAAPRPAAPRRPTPVAAPAVKPSDDSAALSAQEKQFHNGINTYRASRGLAPLKVSRFMCEQAKGHSQNMANGSVPFSHEGGNERGEAIMKRLHARSWGENLALNKGHRNPIAFAVQQLIESPGHHENIVGDFNTTGISVVKNKHGAYYVTELFAKV